MADVGGKVLNVSALTQAGWIVNFEENGVGYTANSLDGRFLSQPAMITDHNGKRRVFAKFASDLLQVRIL